MQHPPSRCCAAARAPSCSNGRARRWIVGEAGSCCGVSRVSERSGDGLEQLLSFVFHSLTAEHLSIHLSWSCRWVLQVSWCGNRCGICPTTPPCPHGCSSSSPAALCWAATSSSDAYGAGARVQSHDAMGRGAGTCGPGQASTAINAVTSRYLCPIGGMNGLFAKMAMTELRARSGVCTSECPGRGRGGCTNGESRVLNWISAACRPVREVPLFQRRSSHRRRGDGDARMPATFVSWTVD